MEADDESSGAPELDIEEGRPTKVELDGGGGYDRVFTLWRPDADGDANCCCW